MNNTKILLSGILVSVALSGFAQPKATNDGFAVLELFTSEGCSSCPPAEAVLERINNQKSQNVYILEYHVDYWNNLGWKDAYSNSEYSKRQQTYENLLHVEGAYTPQVIVNGSVEMVGSDEEKIKNALKKFGMKRNSDVLTIASKVKDGGIDVEYSSTNYRNQVLNVVLVQLNAVTDVKRGENSGRKLTHHNVVRELKTVNMTHSSGHAVLQMPANWSKDNFEVIAFLQPEGGAMVNGAARTSITSNKM